MVHYLFENASVESYYTIRILVVQLIQTAHNSIQPAELMQLSNESIT